MRAANCHVITERAVVTSYRRFGTTDRSHVKGSTDSGNLVPTNWDNLSVQIFKVREVVLISYPRFGTTYRPHLKGPRNSDHLLLTFRDNPLRWSRYLVPKRR
jgi:hypothetical protein